MLCNLKTSYRPDKQLQRALIKLSVAIILLSLSILSIFVVPQYLLYSLGLTILLTICCFVYTIKTLKSGEAAISYGGFANEIIKHSAFAELIENPNGESIIQNDAALKLLSGISVMSFIKKYISEGAANKAALYRLQTAVKNLNQEKTSLSLLFNNQSTHIFNDLEYFEISVAPIYLKKPKIFNGAFSVKRIKSETYLHWKIRNITSQNNLDRVLHDELNTLHDFLDELPIGLYSIDNSSLITYANSELAKFLQTSPQQLIGSSLNGLVYPANSIPLKNDFWFGKVNFSDASKEQHNAYIFQTSYRQNEKIYFRGAVIHNLPTLKNNRHDIEKSLDELNNLLKNFPIGIIFLNSKEEIIHFNDTAGKLLNFNNMMPQRLSSIISGDNLSLLHNAIDRTLTNPHDTNIELKHNDTSLNFYIHRLTDQNEDNLIIYILDISKQKNLETQFAQAQKMQAIGQFAGGVAHDFNNLLTAIIGFTDLLLQRHGIGDPAFADLIQIKQNANRATSLVRQLLAFSRKQPLIPKVIDVTENFADLSQMLKRIIGEKIKLNFQHGPDIGYIKVDPNQFAQVIINLAVNAKDAMNGEGTLSISTQAYHLSEDYTFGDDVISAGDFVKIDVSDTGCGIPEENLNRIFDPFFSTKENIIGSGTGLGLAMVYGIIRQTEGFIKVDSVVGKGTTFSIFLPRLDKMPDEQETFAANKAITDRTGQPILQVQETLSTPANINQKIIMGLNVTHTIDRGNFAFAKNGKAARILFVEDEKSVRTFAVRALKKKGYEVVDSDSAENALNILQNDKNFDLLITDMVLPGISGAQLTNQVKKIMPDLLVILASGYSEDIAQKEVDNTYQFEFITKPYSLDDLTAKVFSVLNNQHDK